MSSKDINIPENLPYSLEAEKALIGGLFLDSNIFTEVAEIITSEDFYFKIYGDIFKTMANCYDTDGSIDVVMVMNNIKKISKIDIEKIEESINEILTSITNTVKLVEYAMIIRDKSTLRRLINYSSKICEMSIKDDRNAEDIVNEAEAMILSVSNSFSKKEVFDSGELIEEFVKKGNLIRDNKGKAFSLSTGYTDLDKKINGLNKSDLIILAARPSMGKTAFALNLLINVASQKKSVLLVSLEMSAQQIFERIISVHSGIPLKKIINRDLNDSEWTSLGITTGNIANMDIKISKQSTSISNIRNIARKLKSEGELDLIVIDYLQLMSSNVKVDNRQQEVSDISRGLKKLAVELNIPIIALSQLSRTVEARADKRPILSDLRESGAIEQDADIVAFLYRDEYYNKDSVDKGIAELIIGKHRNGEIGTVQFLFVPEITKFKSYTNQID